MPMSARLRVAASLFVITIAAACGGDSTGPSQSPSSVAAHFDSLYVQAAVLGDSNGAYVRRSFFLSLFELPPALGANPASITVTTANGVEHWKAFEFLDVNSDSSDSNFVFLAYRESAAHTLILLGYNNDGSFGGGGMITNDTLLVSITQGTGTTSLTSMGTSCGTPSASLENPQIPAFTFSTCHLAKFLTTLSFTTQTSANIDPALASISFSSATLNGIRLKDQSEAATLRRVRAIMQSARVSNRL